MARKPMLTEPGVKPENRRTYSKPAGHLTFGTPPKPKKPKRARKVRAPRRPVQPADPYAPQVEALAKLQYDPQQRELASQRRISDQRMQSIPGWLADYNTRVQQAWEQTRAANAQAQQAVYTQANNAAAQDSQANQQLQQQALQDAQSRGQQIDPSAYQAGQQAASGRQALASSFGGMLASQGQAQQGFVANQQALGGLRQGEMMGAEQAQQRKLDELAQSLSQEIGQFKVKARTDLQDADHKRALENAAFGLDVTKENNDQKNADRDRRLREREARRQARQDRRDFLAGRDDEAFDRQDALTDNQLAREKEQRQGEKDARGGVEKPAFTAVKIRENRAAFRGFMDWAKNNPGASKVPAGYTKDPLMRRAAAQILAKGGVDGKTARQFRAAFGFTPRTRPKKPVDRPGSARGPKGQGRRPT
jgi:hypothetical protein